MNKVAAWIIIIVLLLVCVQTEAQSTVNEPTRELTLDDIFPTNRVLDVQITISDEDWDTIRHQSLDLVSLLNESRKVKPIEKPYIYVDASVTIDDVEFPNVGIRKKGFLGSLSTSRPSLKVQLDYVDQEGGIDGLTNLTLNNNLQDESLVSQFMGYALFSAAGLPAPRCAYAKVTVNGTNLGVYSHVETVREPLLKRAFGNDKGTLYEGPYVDFYEGWEGSFELKTGENEPGLEKIRQLIKVLKNDDEDIEAAIGELIDLDSFYTFWAMEGLLGFWDSYSGNSNNFFVYLNPQTDKFHFLPWGADSLFTKYTKLPYLYDPLAPISVKTQGLIAHKLYQLESSRERYARTIMDVIEKHWNEEELLAEVDRIESMVTPHLVESQLKPAEAGTVSLAFEATREFIRQRRADIVGEIADGMPEWAKVPDEPFVFGASSNIMSAVKDGNIEALKQYISRGTDINAPDEFGITPLGWAALLGQTEVIEFLIQNGADVNAGNNDGATPLHCAVFLGRTEAVKQLIQAGADVNTKNQSGQTPMDTLGADWETTQFIAVLLQIAVNEEEVMSNRNEIADILRQ